jgi:replicative DNA helicase
MKIIKGTTLTSKEMAHAFKEQIRERQEEPEKWRGLQYGHSELDEVTGGLRKGEFIVIAGAQKAGKTTVALVWAQQFARQVQKDELV